MYTAGGRPWLKAHAHNQYIIPCLSHSQSPGFLSPSAPSKASLLVSSHHPLPPTLYRVSFQNYFQTPSQLTSPLAVSQPSTDLSRPLPTCSLRMSSRNFWTPLPRKIRGPRSFICPCVSTSKNSNHAHQSSRKVSNLPTKPLFLWHCGPPLRLNRNVSNMREEIWVCFLSCCNPGI